MNSAGVALWQRRYKQLIQRINRFQSEGQRTWEEHHFELCTYQLFSDLLRRGELGPIDSETAQIYGDAISFVTMLYNLNRHLSEDGRRKLRGRMAQALDESYGFAAIRTEITALNIGLQLGCSVEPIDLDGGGQTFDFLFVRDGEELEVECKLLTRDFLSPTTLSAYHRFGQAIERGLEREPLPEGFAKIVSIEFGSELPRSDEQLSTLAKLLLDFATQKEARLAFAEVTAKSEWWPHGVEDPRRAQAEARFISDLKGVHTLAFTSEKAALVLAMTWKPIRSADRYLADMRRKFKDAVKQLSGRRDGIVFAEFQGPNRFHPEHRDVVSLFEIALERLFRKRTYLQVVVFGFPGPPFTAGHSFVIRNPQIKRRNQPYLVRSLMEISRTKRGTGLPGHEFREKWWRPKYDWSYKNGRGIMEAMQAEDDNRQKS